MKTSRKLRQDLVHDFQADLHSLISTIEQLEASWEERDFCLKAIQIASKRTDRIRDEWENLRTYIKLEGDPSL